MKLARLLSIAMATLILLSAYVFHGIWIYALGVLAIGLYWAFAPVMKHQHAETIGFVGFMVSATGGLLFGFSSIWMLAGVVATLLAWDLENLYQRMMAAHKIESALQLFQQHLRRLLPVILVGSLLGVFALSVRIELGFWWLALLAFAGVIALSRIIGSLRRESD